MMGHELDEIVRELYVLHPLTSSPLGTSWCGRPRQPVAGRSPNRLQHLRRPTRSAWLVNLLASDPTAMQRLSALGRELRDAQTGLARTELRRLADSDGS